MKHYHVALSCVIIMSVWAWLTRDMISFWGQMPLNHSDFLCAPPEMRVQRSLWNHSTTPNCSKQPCLINAALWIPQKHIHELFIQYSFYFNICYTTRTDIKSSFLSLWIYLNWIRQVPGVQVSSFVFCFYIKWHFFFLPIVEWVTMENRIWFLSC